MPLQGIHHWSTSKPKGKEHPLTASSFLRCVFLLTAQKPNADLVLTSILINTFSPTLGFARTSKMHHWRATNRRESGLV